MSQFKLRLDDPGAGDRVIRVAVEASGLEVVGTADGEEAAFELARDTQPDVLIVDLDQLGDGTELLPRVRDVAPDTKVMVVSSDQESRMPALMGAGANGFVHRRITAERLVREVTSLVSGAVAEAATALDGEPTSVGRARRFVGDALSGWGQDDMDGVVGLLVTELVANAVRHAGSDVEVAVHLQHGSLRVEVHDAGEGVPRVVAAGPGDEHGRGVALVEALARAWGVEPTADGKDVWFEISC